MGIEEEARIQQKQEARRAAGEKADADRRAKEFEAMIREFVTLANKIGFPPVSTGIFKKRYLWKFKFKNSTKDGFLIRPDYTWEIHTFDVRRTGDPNVTITSERANDINIQEYGPIVREILTNWAAEHL